MHLNFFSKTLRSFLQAAQVKLVRQLIVNFIFSNIYLDNNYFNRGIWCLWGGGWVALNQQS